MEKIGNIIAQDKYIKFIIDPGMSSIGQDYQNILKDSTSLLEKQIIINNYEFNSLSDEDYDNHRQITFTVENEKFEAIVEYSDYIHIDPIVDLLNRVSAIFAPESNNFFASLYMVGVAYVNQQEYLTLVSNYHIVEL